MKLKFKNKIFEINSNFSYYKCLDTLKQCDGFKYNKTDKCYEIKSTISNYKKVCFLIKRKEFYNYVNELIKKKQSSNPKPSINLNIKTKFPFLYNFQIESIQKFLNSSYNASLLSLDAGLGKSITSLCIMELLKADKIFIICPATLKHQWKEEILKWFKNVSETDITIIE